MDQFAIAMGKEGCAIFLDTADLSYEYAPVQLKEAKIVIACSNKKRGLGDSKYNERRSECEEALAELQKVVDIKTLGDLNEEQFEAVKNAIGSDVRIRRARHAVYENQRTVKAVQALKENNIALFGELMNQSHDSLRDDYEVTGIELDTLVDEARKIDQLLVGGTNALSRRKRLLGKLISSAHAAHGLTDNLDLVVLHDLFEIVNHLAFVGISREIPQIQNIFDGNPVAGFLVHHILILFNYFHDTASHRAVSQNRYLDHYATCSFPLSPMSYSLASIFTRCTP